MEYLVLAESRFTGKRVIGPYKRQKNNIGDKDSMSDNIVQFLVDEQNKMMRDRESEARAELRSNP